MSFSGCEVCDERLLVAFASSSGVYVEPSLYYMLN